MKKITLLWGLPGSGKTTFAKDFVQTNKQYKIIDLDKIGKKPDALKNLFIEVNKSQKHVIIDGLITTNSDAKKIIDALTSIDATNVQFDIIFWNEDRQSCLKNDEGRRTKNSKITIENLPYEIPDRKKLKKVSCFVQKEVYKPSSYEVWLKENVIPEKLKSSTWCMGGTSGNCWDDKLHPVSAEPQPEFVEFDDLLCRIVPNIGFLQYKKLYNSCVTVESRSEGDYYGGRTDNGWYECNTLKLYNTLKELDLV